MTYTIHWISSPGAHMLLSTGNLDTVRNKLEQLFKQRIEAVARDGDGKEVGIVGELAHGPFTWYCKESKA